MKLAGSRRALLAGVVWCAVGTFLAVRGLGYWDPSQALSPGSAPLAVALGLAAGALKGWFVLRRSSGRMIRRIESEPGPIWFWRMYPLYFYPLVLGMIGLGWAIRHGFGERQPWLVLGIYVGIGTALLCSAWPFFAAARRLGAGNVPAAA